MSVKNIFAGIFAVSAMLLLAGCGESPTDVVRAWNDALIAGDVEKANSYCTENMYTRNKLSVVLRKFSGNQADNPQVRDLKSIKFVDEDIDDNTAEVKYNTDKQPGQEVKLLKVNGKWLIDSRD